MSRTPPEITDAPEGLTTQQGPSAAFADAPALAHEPQRVQGSRRHDQVRCPRCDGAGGWEVDAVDRRYEHTTTVEDCDLCDGYGDVQIVDLLDRPAGKLFVEEWQSVVRMLSEGRSE